MKRLINTLFLSICQTFVFAQRGKVRPEWDINGGGSHHSIDDDLYSFLLIVGLIVLYFVYIAIKGSLSRSRGNADHRNTELSQNSNNLEYSNEYLKTGYSSAMPKDDEEKLSEDDANLINFPKEAPYNKWTPIGDAFTLKEICDETGMFNYDDIRGEEAEIIRMEFAGGSSTLRIVIPFKDGTKKELKAGIGVQKKYDEGDKVKIALIYGQELHKNGHEGIVRYDVWESEEEKRDYLIKRDGEELSNEVTEEEDLNTEAREEDFANVWTDEYGVKYSKDRKRLLESPKFLKEYSYADQWLDSMYNLDNLEVLGKIIKEPIQKMYFRHDYYKKHQEHALPRSINAYTINKDTLEICKYAFMDCDNLETIHIPDGVEVIGSCAFEGCKSLSQITIPASAKFIDYMAFGRCIGLTLVVFNGNVSHIGEEVFLGCINLENIVISVGTIREYESMLPEYKDKLVERVSYDNVKID